MFTIIQWSSLSFSSSILVNHRPTRALGQYWVANKSWTFLHSSFNVVGGTKHKLELASSISVHMGNYPRTRWGASYRHHHHHHWYRTWRMKWDWWTCCSQEGKEALVVAVVEGNEIGKRRLMLQQCRSHRTRGSKDWLEYLGGWVEFLSFRGVKWLIPITTTRNTNDNGRKRERENKLNDVPGDNSAATPSHCSSSSRVPIHRTNPINIDFLLGDMGTQRTEVVGSSEQQ